MNRVGRPKSKWKGGLAALASLAVLFSRAALAQPVPSPTGTPVPIITAQPGATPTPVKKPSAKAVPMSAEAYRAMLQRELKLLKPLETHRPRAIQGALRRLDVPFVVRRADGEVQRTDGNDFSYLALEVVKPENATRAEVLKLEKLLQIHLDALDNWLKKPPYRAVNGTKIINNLVATGEIRVAPPWWQQMLFDSWQSIVRVWKALSDWFLSLFPKAPPSLGTSMPSDRWLWMLFYSVVGVLIIVIVWLLWRAFGGKWGRRDVKSQAELQGEDAELLLLPPEELRSRADRYADQGNFREALRHRYLALLLQLDARGVWRYDSHRTNWEHIAALRRREGESDLVEPLSTLTRRFDRVRYGGADCDSEAWRQFDSDTRSVETLVGSTGKAAGAAR